MKIKLDIKKIFNMGFIKSNGIERKIILPVIIIIIILIAGVGGIVIKNRIKQAKANVEQDATSLVQLIETTCYMYVQSFDDRALDMVVKDLIKDKEIAFAVFYDDSKQPLSTVSKEPSPAAQAEMMVYSTKIADEQGSVLGYFTIGYTTDIKKQITSVIFTIFLVTILFLLFLSIGIRMIIKKVVINPVVSLKNSLATLEEKGDFSIRLDVSSNDEIGNTAASFNTMMESLQKAIKDTITVMTAVANGDFSKRITDDLKGDLKILKDNINDSSDSVETTMSALNGVMLAISNGVFSERCNADVKGEFKTNVDNAMISMEDTIGNISKVMKAVAEGDLTERVVVEAKGDLAALKDNINTSLTTFSEILASIVNSTNHVAKSANQTTRAVEQMSDDTQDQVASVVEIAEAVGETSNAINEVTENANLASKSARESVQTVKEGQDKMHHMMTLVGAVADNNAKINKITGVIGSIAAQTNLLSLNAAIEAARAGEHGKGFAVVAEEVRKLAEDSSTSADDISKLVDEAVKSVTKAVGAAEQVNMEMDKISAISSDSEVMLSKMAEAMAQQNEIVLNINKNITKLNTISENNASATEEITAIVTDLASMTSKTHEEAEKFKL